MGDSTADKFYRQGAKLAQEKQYQAALSIFSEATQSDPYHEQAWVAKGVCEAHLQNYNAAYQSFEKALEINPDNQQAKKNLEMVSPHVSLPDIPMPDLLVPGSLSKQIRNYSTNWFLILWPFLVLIGWAFVLSSFNIFTASIVIPFCAVTIMLLSAIYIGIDASGIEAGKGSPSKFGNSLSWKPIEWALLTFFFLIIFYPLYLLKRREIFENQYGPTTNSKKRTPAVPFALFFIFIFSAVLVLGSITSAQSTQHKSTDYQSITISPTLAGTSIKTRVTVVPTKIVNTYNRGQIVEVGINRIPYYYAIVNIDYSDYTYTLLPVKRDQSGESWHSVGSQFKQAITTFDRAATGAVQVNVDPSYIPDKDWTLYRKTKS